MLGPCYPGQRRYQEAFATEMEPAHLGCWRFLVAPYSRPAQLAFQQAWGPHWLEDCKDVEQSTRTSARLKGRNGCCSTQRCAQLPDPQVQYGTYGSRARHLWKFQQEHRQTLEMHGGLRRHHIGETASRIGQLYYHFYLRATRSARDFHGHWGLLRQRAGRDRRGWRREHGR